MKDNNVTLNISGWPLLVTVLLCILKLTGVINISWWWCFCLFWLPFAIILAIVFSSIFEKSISSAGKSGCYIRY